MKASMKALCTVMMVLLSASCGPSPEHLTATVVMAQAQTQTAVPTRTATFTATSTPQPTSTPTRTPKPTNTPPPTPASIGESIKFDPLEITLLLVETHSHIVPGGYYYFYAKPGFIFIDLGVLVRNTTATPVTMYMKNLYIIDKNGDKWFSNFGGAKTVEVGRLFNPLSSISLRDVANTGEEKISIEKDTYLRLVFYVQDNQRFGFAILDSPQFAFDVNTK
jgi:hypothetical protein